MALKINYGFQGHFQLQLYYTGNAVQIKNNGKFIYEFIVGAKDAEKAPESGKVTKIASNKTATLTGFSNFATIWIRKQAIKRVRLGLAHLQN